MHFIRSLGHRRVALAAIAIFAVAGGVAYAAIPDAGTGVYHACMLKNIGTIRIIDPERQRCSSSLEVEITFNKQGPAGVPGPTGPPGPPGHDGRDGHDGAPFSGTFTSPNGEYSLSVTDAGIVLSGAASTISLTSSGLALQSDKDLTLQSAAGFFVDAGTGVSIAGGGSASTINLTSSGVGVHSDKNLTLQSGLGLFAQAGSGVSISGAGSAATISLASSGVEVRSDRDILFQSDLQLLAQAGSTATLEAGGVFSIAGGSVRVNPGASCRPAARITDAIAGTAPPNGGAVTGLITSGSGTVCVG